MDNRALTIPLRLVRTHNTRDPFQLAKLLGHSVKYLDLKNQKGFCTNIYSNYFIFINGNLSNQMQRMTCAHELGHVILHKDRLGRDRSGKLKRFVEMELFDIKNETEYEANLFAANLLIDESDMLEKLQNGYDIVSTAASLDVNVNLLAIKLAEMNKHGLPVGVPFIPDRKFMGRIMDCADSY